MENAELIDYAHPMMMAEMYLKKAHDAALHKDYELATAELLNVIVEARLATHAINHMKEQNA